MVTQGILSAVLYLVGHLLALLPALPDPSSFFGTVESGISTVVGKAASFGGWIPFSAVAIAIAIVFAGQAASWGVKLVRIALSLFSAGGGSAG